jgi:hypothetical protein
MNIKLFIKTQHNTVSIIILIVNKTYVQLLVFRRLPPILSNAEKIYMRKHKFK